MCLDAAAGKRVWKKNLVSDFGGGVPQWGYSESPLVDGGNVVVTPGNKTGMVALEADTGEVAWKCEELKDGAGYSAIIPVDVGGVRTYVQQTMAHAVGVRAADGKLLFSTGEIGRRVAVIPTPVVVGDLAFFTSGYGAGCECYRLKADGTGGVTAEKVYSKNKVLANHHGGVIEQGGYVFGHSDSDGGQWVCFDYKAGADEPVWKAKGPGKGSITYADGHFYLYGEGKGELVRIKATNAGFEEAGRFTIPQASADRKGTQGKVWPHPVVANGKALPARLRTAVCVRSRRQSGGQVALSPRRAASIPGVAPGAPACSRPPPNSTASPGCSTRRCRVARFSPPRSAASDGSTGCRSPPRPNSPPIKPPTRPTAVTGPPRRPSTRGCIKRVAPAPASRSAGGTPPRAGPPA